MNFSFLKETVLQNWKLQTSQRYLSACKIMEQILLENMSRHVDDREVIKDSQTGFIKRIFIPANLGIYGRLAGLVDKGRETDVLYCVFFKAFVTVPQKISAAKLERYAFNGWSIHWIRNWMNDSFQKSCMQWLSVQRTSLTSGIPQAEDFPYGTFHMEVV